MSEDVSRRPRAERAARMAPLAVLPVFLKLKGRRSSSRAAARRPSGRPSCSPRAGAEVAVYAPRPCPAMLDWRRRRRPGPSPCTTAPGPPADLGGAAFAIGAFEGDADAAAFAAAARGAGVPVNVIDKPAFCDVQFGGIVNRSPLVIGISTDGAAPVFGQAVRARIEALLPQGFARWADAARRWRRACPVPRSAVPGAPPLLGALLRARHGDAGGRAAGLPRDRAGTRGPRHRRGRTGRIVLVGAGPGDPELLTMRAVRALQSADVIVHDDLVPSAVLDVARREAERISAGKRGRGPSCRQEDINALVIRLAARASTWCASRPAIP